VLLAREKRNDKWSLPGGWADVGETPMQGVKREVFEETGYEVRVIRLTFVRDQSLHGYKPRYPVHVYKMYFLCRITSGNFRENSEISEIRFFPLNALPALSQGTTLEEDILHLHEYHQNPAKPVDCD
jgi:ADP-ribose pyrophosphatase YjhB (NUDIX family)